jgi:hypothetical protein
MAGQRGFENGARGALLPDSGKPPDRCDESPHTGEQIRDHSVGEQHMDAAVVMAVFPR